METYIGKHNAGKFIQNIKAANKKGELSNDSYNKKVQWVNKIFGTKHEPIKNKSASKKTTPKYGLQKDGTFIATNRKIWGREIEKLKGQKHPPSVFEVRKGHIRTKVQKVGNLYQVTRYKDGKPISRENITDRDFEYNYMHHV